MPVVPDEPGLCEGPRPHISLDDLDPNDINPDWLDNMVKRLFTEVQRQLSQVEGFKAESNTGVAEREKNARTLASLEHTLERLNRLDAERSAIRKSKGLKHDGNVRKTLARKLSRVLAIEFKIAGGAGEGAEESDG